MRRGGEGRKRERGEAHQLSVCKRRTHTRTDTHCHPQPSSVAEHKLPNLDRPVCRRRRWELGPAHLAGQLSSSTHPLLLTPPSPPATPSSFRRPSGPANVGHSSHMSHRPEQQPVCCRPQRAAKVCVGGRGQGGGGSESVERRLEAQHQRGLPHPVLSRRGECENERRGIWVTPGPPSPPPSSRGSFLDSPVSGLLPLNSVHPPGPSTPPKHTQPIGQENEKERAAGASPSACKCARVSCASRRGRMKPWSRDLSLLKKTENLFSFFAPCRICNGSCLKCFFFLLKDNRHEGLKNKAWGGSQLGMETLET